jgi:hypothetical protein
MERGCRRRTAASARVVDFATPTYVDRGLEQTTEAIEALAAAAGTTPLGSFSTLAQATRCRPGRQDEDGARLVQSPLLCDVASSRERLE